MVTGTVSSVDNIEQAKCIIGLVSKFLILVIMCNLSTLALIIVIFVSVSIDYTDLGTTLHQICAAMDIVVAVFVIYSHFTFGEWIYHKICHKCHNIIQNRFLIGINNNTTAVITPTLTSTSTL